MSAKIINGKKFDYSEEVRRAACGSEPRKNTAKASVFGPGWA